MIKSYSGRGYIITLKPDGTFDYVRSWSVGHFSHRDSGHGVYQKRNDSLFLNYEAKPAIAGNVKGIVVMEPRPQFAIKKNNVLEIRTSDSSNIILRRL
jgi:hypothetical protein